MTDAQRNEIQAQLMAIGQINAALQAGTDSGLFDEMAACISHPDLINKFCDDMAKMTACYMSPFKVTAAGFDNADNETNDRVFFVSAPNAQVIEASIEGTGANVLVYSEHVISIDFNLPFQSEALRSALLKFSEAESAKQLAIPIDPIAKHPKIFLETLGYKIDGFSEVTEQWFWRKGPKGKMSFSTGSDALEGAWKDAVSNTMRIRNITSKQWDALSFARQKIQITQALSQDETVKATQTQRIEHCIEAVDVIAELPAMEHHSEMYLKTLGYQVYEKCMADGLWQWFTPEKFGNDCSSASDAFDDAWKDAVGLTMGIKNIASEQWDVLSLEQQKVEITAALSHRVPDWADAHKKLVEFVANIKF